MHKVDPSGRSSKAWICGRSLTGIAVSNPTEGIDVRLLWVLCCPVEVSTSGSLVVQRSPSECNLFKCDNEAFIMESQVHKGLLRHDEKIRV